MSKSLTVILASGGTGGHIFPAVAVARKLKEGSHKPILVVDKKHENYSKMFSGIDVLQVKSASPSGGLTAKLKALIFITIGFLQARKIIKKQRPNIVVGFGGYPSFPVLLAARSLKIKTLIHEQNAVLGRVNKVMVGFVEAIATSFVNTEGISKNDEKKVVLTGNPVRKEIAVLHALSYPELKLKEHLHILVIGGSQGARIFSRVIPQAIIALPTHFKEKIRIDQQCRAEDIDKVKYIYEQNGVNADLSVFFGDIAARMASAHLVIARAGASTITELTAAGRPSILVPFKGALDNHQEKNANFMKNAEAARVILEDDFNEKALIDELELLIEQPGHLLRMAKKAKSLGGQDAADNLLKLFLQISS